MARELSPLFYVHMVLGFILVRILVVVGQPQVPCYFIFGDSMLDNGNNNGLETTAKANYPPYGIDFPLGVTGRSSNGRTYADVIGELLGFSDFIPPYVNVTDQEISTGVNYASIGAGILDESGKKLGDRFSLNKQIINHRSIVERLSLIQRDMTFTQDYLKKCIYLVHIGSTDYFDNYFLPDDFPTSQTYTLDKYAEVLVQQYCQQLKTLYELGARKVAVIGMGLIGCTPASGEQTCNDTVNNASKLFDDRLMPLVEKFNNDFYDARFTFINLTSIGTPPGGDFLPTPACCRPFREDGQCIPNSTPCPNRDLAHFFDAFNPSDRAASDLASRSFYAFSPMDASPFDISHLAQLDNHFTMDSKLNTLSEPGFGYLL